MVKCEECGFLALRNRNTGLLDEAPQEYRRAAEVPPFNSPLSDAYTGVPICLARAYPLHNEFTNQDQATHREIFNLLQKKRNCAERDLFTPWQQGFSPKEHREMLDRQWMLEREERWGKELRDSEAKRETSSRRWRIIELLAFIIAGAATAIIAALIERGTLFSNGTPPMP